MDTAGIAPDETFAPGEDAVRRRRPTHGRPASRGEPEDEEEAAARLYDLALTYQERSQQTEARAHRAVRDGRQPADREARRHDHRRRRGRATDARGGRRLPRRGRARGRRTASGKTLVDAEQIVEFYDPTDVFGDLAEALAEAFPAVAERASRDEDGEDRGRRGADDEDDERTCRATVRRRHGRARAPTRPEDSRPRVSMRLVAAELVDSREILPRPVAPVVPRADARRRRARRPVRPRPDRRLSGLVLRRPFSFNTVDPLTGIITIHYPDRSAAARTGSRGCGRATPSTCSGRSAGPFEVDPRSRHLLLIAGGLGIAGVRMLADEAIRDGRQVTLLFGAAIGARGLPVQPAARRGRVRRRDRRRLARPPRLRDRARARATRPGPTRPSPAARTRCSRRCQPLAAGRRRAARRRQARSEARRAASRIRWGRRRRGGRRSCRSRWSRTWAARSGRVSAAS